MLHAKVSGLEQHAGVRRLASRLAADEEGALERMRTAHSTYAERRWGLLTPADRALAEARGWGPRLQQVGVAGMRFEEPVPEGSDAAPALVAGVKCLHTHLAHFLATGDNPVGKWVAEDLAAAAEEDGVIEAVSSRSRRGSRARRAATQRRKQHEALPARGYATAQERV